MGELQSMIDEELKNPAFREAWDEGEVEYQIRRLIIRARLDEGLTQKELAEKTSIAQTNISAIERGSRVPSVKTLQRIAEGLGRTIKIEMV